MANTIGIRSILITAVLVSMCFLLLSSFIYDTGKATGTDLNLSENFPSTTETIRSIYNASNSSEETLMSEGQSVGLLSVIASGVGGAIKTLYSSISGINNMVQEFAGTMRANTTDTKSMPVFPKFIVSGLLTLISLIIVFAIIKAFGSGGSDV